jgi:hypothetical protein
MAALSPREPLPPGTPISLPVEVLGGERPRSAPTPILVEAWVTVTGGYQGEFRRVSAVAVAWTSRAVHLRWRRPGELDWTGWVWANAVRRKERLIQGLPATHRPGLIAYRGPR